MYIPEVRAGKSTKLQMQIFLRVGYISLRKELFQEILKIAQTFFVGSESSSPK
jgi:hypothetical protein